MPQLSEDAKILRYFKKKLEQGHCFNILIGMDTSKEAGFPSGTYLFANLKVVKGKIEIKPTGTSNPTSSPFARK